MLFSLPLNEERKKRGWLQRRLACYDFGTAAQALYSSHVRRNGRNIVAQMLTSTKTIVWQ
jgi:hypothetical protein